MADRWKAVVWQSPPSRAKPKRKDSLTGILVISSVVVFKVDFLVDLHPLQLALLLRIIGLLQILLLVDLSWVLQFLDLIVFDVLPFLLVVEVARDLQD